MKLYDVIRKEQLEREEEKQPPGQKKVLLDTDASHSELLSGFTPPKPPTKKYREKILRKKVIIFLGVIVLLAVLYLIGIYFVYAKVTVQQRQIPFSLLDTQFTLANSTVADPSRLSFQTMIVTDSVSRQVFGSAMSTSTTKAVGKIVIFNQYSKSTQTVRSGTTVTGANGEKYITQSTVSVPGYTGSAKTAGSATVAIIASGVGPAYNTSGTTFTISGWSGNNAKLFFASSVGAITGGQNGAMHTLSDSDAAEATATLESDLREKLDRETRGQIPDNFITFPDLQFVTINDNSLTLTGDTIEFPASVSGSMVSYLIPREPLEQAIASKVSNNQAAYTNVTIPALGDIHVEPVSVIPTDPKNTPDTIVVSITGQGVVVPQVSVTNIQDQLAAIPRHSFASIMSTIPGIDSATFSLYPFWASYFPSTQSRINVVIN